MKAAVVSADVLFEQHRETLRWQWIAGQSASERRFDEVALYAAVAHIVCPRQHSVQGVAEFVHEELELAMVEGLAVEDGHQRCERCAPGDAT